MIVIYSYYISTTICSVWYLMKNKLLYLYNRYNKIVYNKLNLNKIHILFLKPYVWM